MTSFARSTCSACFKAVCRGLPGGNSLSFASPKESKQRKGDPVRRPLRGTLRCSVQPGSETTRLRLKQVSALIRLALRFSAPLQGFGDECEARTLASSALRLRLPESAPEFTPHPVEAGPSSADGGGRSGQTCLSRRRVVWTAAGVEQRRLPVATAKGPRRRVAFSLVTFLLAKQKKVTSRRATPGLVVKGKALAHATGGKI